MSYDRLITNSSSVSRIQYSPDQRVLRITYMNGATFDYKEVPETVWEELSIAESVGSYVAQQVKPNYQYEKITE